MRFNVDILAMFGTFFKSVQTKVDSVANADPTGGLGSIIGLLTNFDVYFDILQATGSDGGEHWGLDFYISKLSDIPQLNEVLPTGGDMGISIRPCGFKIFGTEMIPCSSSSFVQTADNIAHGYKPQRDGLGFLEMAHDVGMLRVKGRTKEHTKRDKTKHGHFWYQAGLLEEGENGKMKVKGEEYIYDCKCGPTPKSRKNKCTATGANKCETYTEV